MRPTVALLLSLMLHAAVIVAPIWLAPGLPLSTANLEARLIPRHSQDPMAEAVSTKGEESAAVPSPAAQAIALQGHSLRRAQTALSKHLFYPPEAVARGLEGQVILLLTLSESGQLVSATIARSSGHALLDQAALDAARQIRALPGNPRQTLFPVNFRLQ
jgi:periplasmic protein TonB